MMLAAFTVFYVCREYPTHLACFSTSRLTNDIEQSKIDIMLSCTDVDCLVKRVRFDCIDYFHVGGTDQ